MPEVGLEWTCGCRKVSHSHCEVWWWIGDVAGCFNVQQILNQNLTASARKLKLGCGWVFQQDSDPNHTSKLTQKLFTDHRIKVHRKSIGSVEEESLQAQTPEYEGSGYILYGGMASDSLPCVLQSH